MNTIHELPAEGSFWRLDTTDVYQVMEGPGHCHVRQNVHDVWELAVIYRSVSTGEVYVRSASHFLARFQPAHSKEARR